MRYTIKLSVLILVFLISCAKVTEEKRAKLAQELYTEGMAAYTNRDYRKSAERLKESLKYMENLTPQQIKEAKYAIAESYYLRKDYINAAVYLEDFISSYPESMETERAYFMLVESYMKVAPDAYRDQTYTLKAIERAKDFITKYPESSYTDRVIELIEKANTKIAQHEYLIARFYEDFGYYYSASSRYRDIMLNYQGQISDVDVSYRYIKSLLLTKKQAKRQQDKYTRWIKEAESALKKAKNQEEREAIAKRIEFFKSEIDRWGKIAEDSYSKGLDALEKYRELYGENNYYKELQRYAK